MTVQSLNIVFDINHDGHYSAWEISEVLKDLYHIPGNLLVEALGHIPFIAEPLGIHASQATGYSSLNGTLAVLVSLVFWMLVLFTALSKASPTVSVDDDAETTQATQSEGVAQSAHDNVASTGLKWPGTRGLASHKSGHLLHRFASRALGLSHKVDARHAAQAPASSETAHEAPISGARHRGRHAI